jgi:hypothetical protein
MKSLQKLAEKIRAANNDMQAELERRFPVGSRVSCFLMHGQVKPSHGEVIGHTGGEHAYIRIRLNSRTGHVRDVVAEDVRLLA